MHHYHRVHRRRRRVRRHKCGKEFRIAPRPRTHDSSHHMIHTSVTTLRATAPHEHGFQFCFIHYTLTPQPQLARRLHCHTPTPACTSSCLQRCDPRAGCNVNATSGGGGGVGVLLSISGAVVQVCRGGGGGAYITRGGAGAVGGGAGGGFSAYAANTAYNGGHATTYGCGRGGTVGGSSSSAVSGRDGFPGAVIVRYEWCAPTDCPAGYEGQPVSCACATGKYKAVAGSTACNDCAAGTASTTRALTAAFPTCPAGQI